MEIRVDTNSPIPPARQLVQSVLDAIARAEIREGEALPSVRRLASVALVNPNTVGKAYRDLESLGVVAGRVGRGVFVLEGATEKARERRREESKRTLEDAIQSALRAGLEPETLMQWVDEQLGSFAKVEGGPCA